MSAAGEDDERERPELPRLVGRYRLRWREPLPGAPDGARATLVGKDTVVDRELDVARIPFGAERLGERDAFVTRLKGRTTVLHPALVVVHDAGEWGDDAFVATEQIERGVPLREGLASLDPSMSERLSWARSLAEAAVVLDETGLAIEPADWERTQLDAYRQPRVPGLERAKPATDQTRRESVRALGRLLDALSPKQAPDPVERDARIELDDIAGRCSEDLIDLRTIRDRLAPLAGPPEAERPLIAQLEGASLRRREASLLLVGMALFITAFVVLVIALISR